MRPVTKWTWPQVGGAQKSYNPHTIAKTDLELNFDTYCSYCEVFSSDLEVEHVISRNQNPTLTHNWDNFLLACGRCNGRDNKSNKVVDFSLIHFPHLNNTFLSFEYHEWGYVKVNPALAGISQTKAENLINLVGLDKIPGNPKYPNLNPNDTRWRHRRTAWEWAVRKLSDYEAASITYFDVVDFALQKGFFSVWYSVFGNHTDVKRELVTRMLGTAQDCFDPANGYQPIPRNPGAVDTI